MSGRSTTGGSKAVREEVREAALEVLVPVARKATTQAATYAVARGPRLTRRRLLPRVGAAIEAAGGPAALAKRALTLIPRPRTRSHPRPWRDWPLPVEESIDVVVPLEAAYDRFTDFNAHADLLSRGETTGERRNERIAWSRTDGVEARAVITFHRLSERLTRVMVTYDPSAAGLLQRAASVFRAARGVSADLTRFKAFAETRRDIQPSGRRTHGGAATR